MNAYLGLGDNEQALAWLERAYQEQSNILQLIRSIRTSIPCAMILALKELAHKVGLD